MSYQVLARKYRPQKFSEVIGQEHVTRTLKNAIEQSRIAHGYIFSGHRGIGKTTVARILAMALNCRSGPQPVSEPCGVCDSCVEIRAGNSVDVIEIDAATNRGIDEIRELREAARYRPARDRFKIYILDEAHQITDAAFNALLKTLEEPPGHVVFMMATTQPEDIPQTIRSRCQHFSFRAVKFDQIIDQLKDLCQRENIAAEEEALALLAEAGDGSMRDALSLLDQAIASGEGKLVAESVRHLTGVTSSGILEEIMQAVARSASDEILHTTDRLLSEGQNPSHFAKQLVRFLRNAIVAKVSGNDSSLLQISSDERNRVARVAELFSEEDLARHLQIMLRTHAELGYRQEQRFHLELGLLKLAHAQRLLPIEQLLSGVEPAKAGTPDRKLSLAPEPKKTEPSTTAREFASPFAADSARKGKPRMEAVSEPQNASPRPPAPVSPPVVMGSAAPAVARELQNQPSDSEPTTNSAKVDGVRAAVLNAVESAGLNMFSSMLSAGEWAIHGNELIIKVAASAALIDMSVSNEGRKILAAAASGALGRPIRPQVLPGLTPQPGAPRPASSGSNGSPRGRAEQEPVVQRMMEKFGAEIRAVIDYAQKK
ncbi:MAG TPA: DNA polymerase III subunit gamma/tau [Terriglobales bacterium]|jgi:DNA polymerase-3 subunit gamma/tau|nr:DNA polymerase III subunit gamma/tau [Terriglobales bacterium]